MKNKHNPTLSAQRERLLAWLRTRPLSTVEARHSLDILAPAARVHELRWGQDFNIKTESITKPNPGGGEHRVALYVLLAGKWQDKNGGNEND